MRKLKIREFIDSPNATNVIDGEVWIFSFKIMLFLLYHSVLLKLLI